MKVKPLLEAVSAVFPAADHKGLVPEFKHLYFDEKYVQATNGSLFIRADLEEPCPKFAIDSEVFYALLKTVTSDTVELELSEKALTLKAKGMKSELALPGSPATGTIDFDVKEWTKVPDGLMKGLFLCRFTACPDQTAGPLTGVRIEKDAILSCDRWRISLYSVEAGAMAGVTLPVDLLDELKGYASQIKGYAVKDQTIYFDLGRARIGAKLVQGTFPSDKLFGAMDQVEGASGLTLTADLKEKIVLASKRQNILEGNVLEFDRMSKFTYTSANKKGKIILYAENQATGTIEEVIECKGVKGEFSFFINPMFLLEMFEETDSLLYSEKHTVACFEGNQFMHLVKTKVPEAQGA